MGVPHGKRVQAPRVSGAFRSGPCRHACQIPQFYKFASVAAKLGILNCVQAWPRTMGV